MEDELKFKKEQLAQITKHNINPTSRIIDSFGTNFSSSKLGKIMSTGEMLATAYRISPLLGIFVSFKLDYFTVGLLEDSIMIISGKGYFRCKWEDCKKYSVEILTKKNWLGTKSINISFSSKGKKFFKRGVICRKERAEEAICQEAFDFLKSKF